MQVTKCDICKKEFKKDHSKVFAGLGWLNSFELCTNQLRKAGNYVSS